MLNLELIKITEICGAEPVCSSSVDFESIKHKKIAGVTIDSRKAGEGFVFVASKGERRDGHEFIRDVFKKGAAAVICEHVPEDHEEYPGVFFKVDNSIEALKTLAREYRRILGDTVKVVGITGSVGKTSTKEFVASVLSRHYKIHKTQGNQNNQIGVPLEILSISDDTEVAVLEMGISEFGEMERLSEFARPDICIITNIGECHLESLGDRDGVLKAKTAIFSSMSKNGEVILNGFDDKLCTVGEVNGKKPFRFGRNIDDVYATDVKDRGLLGSDITVNIAANPKDSFKVHVPLPGKHMINNALTATMAGLIMDLTTEEIISGIEAVRATSGRSNVIKTDSYILIDDCYNANPTSMKAAIDMLMIAEGRKVAILGDMFELGKDEAKLHENVGRYAAGSGVEVIICIGKLAKHIYDGAMSALMCEKQEIYYFPEKEDLSARRNIFCEGDTILIKASNGMHFNTILEELM